MNLSRQFVLLPSLVLAFAAYGADSDFAERKELSQQARYNLIQGQVKTACDARGSSRARQAIATEALANIEREIGTLAKDIQAVNRWIAQPGAELRKVEDLEARQQHRREVQKFFQMWRESRQSDREKLPVRLNEQRSRVILASLRLHDPNIQLPAADPEYRTEAHRALGDLHRLAGLSDRYQKLRNDARFCLDRSLGFPGKPYAPFEELPANVGVGDPPGYSSGTKSPPAGTASLSE
jgi:hypothetical protein